MAGAVSRETESSAGAVSPNRIPEGFFLPALDVRLAANSTLLGEIGLLREFELSYNDIFSE